MKAINVSVHHYYTAKVSGHIVPIQLVADHHAGGWSGINTRTGKRIRIRTAAKLRYEVWPCETCDGYTQREGGCLVCRTTKVDA